MNLDPCKDGSLHDLIRLLDRSAAEFLIREASRNIFSLDHQQHSLIWAEFRNQAAAAAFMLPMLLVKSNVTVNGWSGLDFSFPS